MNSANGGDILYHFKGDTSDLEKKTNDLSKDLKSSLNTIGKAMTLGVTVPLTTIATAGVKYNAELESYTANLTTLLGGNKKQAEELLNTLKETAKTTPYETSHLVKATQTMMAFGISADNAKKYLNQIGDISMGNAEKLSGLTLAFSQVQSAGRLTGQDLLQMINQGFNPLKIISEETGESMADLKDRMAEGGVSAEEVAHAFEVATSKSGLFYKGMEKGAQTTEGRISTLKDSFKEATGSLTEALLPTLLSLVKTLTKVADWFSNLSDSGKKTILVIGGIVASIGPLIKMTLGIMELASAFKVLFGVLVMNPIGLIITAIVLVIGALVLLYNKCEWFRNLVNTLFSHIMKGIQEIWTELEPLVSLVISIIKAILTALQPFIDWIKEHLVNFIKMYVAGMIIYIDMIVSIIKFAIQTIKTIIRTVVDVIQSVIDFAKSIPARVRNFVNQIVGFFQALPSKMLSVGLDIVKGIGKGITSGVSWLKNRIKEFVGNVTKFIKKVFKIGSPSKLMSDQVGQWIPKGIAVGIDANTDSVYKAMQDMSNIGLDTNFVNQSGLHYSPNVIVNNNVNMKTDPLGQVVGNIKTFSGGAKNDYNYGMGV